jgi:hypothetical protein
MALHDGWVYAFAGALKTGSEQNVAAVIELLEQNKEAFRKNLYARNRFGYGVITSSSECPRG